jgi:hypothetical protein
MPSPRKRATTQPEAKKLPGSKYEVRTGDAARVPIFEPTLDIPVTVDSSAEPAHRLVVIGDSLSHGFQSGAVFHTRYSWPSIVAWELGLSEAEFIYPQYVGHGGLPLNIEYLLRELEKSAGRSLEIWEWPTLVFQLNNLLDGIQDYWERGPGRINMSRRGPRMHNLAIFGFDVADAINETVATCESRLKGKPAEDQFWPWQKTVELAREIASLPILASATDDQGQALTVIGAAKYLSALGRGKTPGIETLIVALGANNALGAVTSLKPNWTEPGKSRTDRNVWRPEDFESDWKQLEGQLLQINAKHVIIATVPHITIPPVTRGVGADKLAAGSRYFPYYTRPWIIDSAFNPKDDPAITGDQAREIDSAIDYYNDTLTESVRKARKAGKDWYLFEMSGLLDRLAARRFQLDIKARPDWWTPYELPSSLAKLDPVPDTRFLFGKNGQRIQGGLFSLDGVHPTTIGYGLIAQEVIEIMQMAGVRFRFSDGSQRPGLVMVDFERLLSVDLLVKSPPALLDDSLSILSWLTDNVPSFITRLLR